jgi:hypothetical protein
VQTATVLSYGLTLGLTIGTLLGYGAAAVVDQTRGTDEPDPPSFIIALNPVAIVGDLVGGSGSVSDTSPFDAIKILTDPDEEEVFAFDDVGEPVPAVLPPGVAGDVVAEEVLIVGDLAADVGRGFQPQPDGDAGVPFWAGSLVALSGLSTLALLRASRRLRTPAERER